MHKYSVNIYWSDEDQVFIAEVPDLPGCITHGDTHASALANANDAINLWIETAEEFGDTIPLAKGRSVISASEDRDTRRTGRSAASLSIRRKNKPAYRYDILKSQLTTNPRSR
jgi:predicted RNase H-like HicB family nuclease